LGGAAPIFRKYGKHSDKHDGNTLDIKVDDVAELTSIFLVDGWGCTLKQGEASNFSYFWNVHETKVLHTLGFFHHCLRLDNIR
jgi:hypothetical protein